MLSAQAKRNGYSRRRDSVKTDSGDLMTTSPYTDSDASFDTASTTSASAQNIQDLAQDLIFLLQRNEKELYIRVKKCIKRFKHRAHELFVTDIGGWTPFHAVTLRGQKRVLKLMLNCGVDVNHKMGEPEGLPGGCTPLHVAAYRGDLKVIKCLLSRGGYVNVRNEADLTPVYYAVKTHNIEVVNLLLTYGADLKGVQTSEPEVTLTRPQTVPKPKVFCGLRFSFKHKKL